MNVLFLTQYFSRTSGGSEAVFFQWSKELSKRGHHVYVICQDVMNIEKESYPESVTVLGVPPLIESTSGLPTSAKGNLRYLFDTIRLGIEITRKHDIDIIHANNFVPIFAGYVISTLTNRPFISTIHDLFSVAGFEYWRKWAAQSGNPYLILAGPLLEKLSVKTPAVNHTVSQETKKDILKFGGSNPIFVIPNGIDLEDYSAQDYAGKNKNQIVFIGRHVFYKNVSTVIKAMKIVEASVPDACLVIAGSGPMRKYWEQMVEDIGLKNSVRFEGNVSHSKKLELLNDSKALVLPSTFEGFGVVILESFAMRKPVIVSKIPPMTEIVADGIDGYLVSPFNEYEWADRILSILQNPQMALRMGEKGRFKVEKNYTMQKVTDQLEKKYYDQTIQRATKRAY